LSKAKSAAQTWFFMVVLFCVSEDGSGKGQKRKVNRDKVRVYSDGDILPLR